MKRVAHGHIHSSGRYDRGTRAIADALERHLRVDKPDVYTSTEAANKKHRVIYAALAGEYGYSHHQGRSGQDDCVILLRRARFRARKTWDDQLTTLPQNRARSGPIANAISVLVEDRAGGVPIIYTVSHLTAGVEGIWFKAKMMYRERVWRSAHATWSRRTFRRRRYYKAKVVMVSDWNLNLERKVFRTMLRAMHPRLRLTWKRFPGPGTHGGRVIDGSLTDLQIVRGAALTRDDSSSDHRPYREVLR